MQERKSTKLLETYRKNLEPVDEFADFARRHYQAVADLIASTQTRDELIEGLIRLFRRDNANFDEGRFRRAAGLD